MPSTLALREHEIQHGENVFLHFSGITRSADEDRLRVKLITAKFSARFRQQPIGL